MRKNKQSTGTLTCLDSSEWPVPRSFDTSRLSPRRLLTIQPTLRTSRSAKVYAAHRSVRKYGIPLMSQIAGSCEWLSQRLEPCAGKLACTVLRRAAAGNSRRLSDIFMPNMHWVTSSEACLTYSKITLHPIENQRMLIA